MKSDSQPRRVEIFQRAADLAAAPPPLGPAPEVLAKVMSSRRALAREQAPSPSGISGGLLVCRCVKFPALSPALSSATSLAAQRRRASSAQSTFSINIQFEFPSRILSRAAAAAESEIDQQQMLEKNNPARQRRSRRQRLWRVVDIGEGGFSLRAASREEAA